MESELEEQLAEKLIKFCFYPPASPHFDGVWEREIQSVKKSLQVVIGPRVLKEDVLPTLLIEVEGILNSKSLGCASSDVTLFTHSSNQPEVVLSHRSSSHGHSCNDR